MQIRLTYHEEIRIYIINALHVFVAIRVVLEPWLPNITDFQSSDKHAYPRSLDLTSAVRHCWSMTKSKCVESLRKSGKMEKSATPSTAA